MYDATFELDGKFRSGFRILLRNGVSTGSICYNGVMPSSFHSSILALELGILVSLLGFDFQIQTVRTQ